MKIKTLRLENFQGIRRAEYEFGGHSASIYGDNATGKTTLFNAVTWLLFDKASTGAKNYTPKTKGPEGDLHNLDHAAEAVCMMDDGSLVTFRKDYHEVYKKKRGSAAETFDGHTVDFYIDGVPVKEKEYSTTVQAFCGGIERMKMLTMPDYFAEAMDWKERRKILLELSGDVSDEDVIVSDPELRELRGFLRKPGTEGQYYAVEAYRKKAEAQKRDINSELDAIPARIDEAQRAIRGGAEDVSGILPRIEELSARKAELERDRAAALSGDTALMEARKRTAEAEAGLAKARSDFLASAGAGKDAVLDEITRLASRQIICRDRADTLSRQAKGKREKAADLSKTREELRKEGQAVFSSAFDRELEVCPQCGQRLPREKIDQLISDFNLRKSRRLSEISARGQQECSQEIIRGLEAEAAAAEAESAAARAEAEELQRQMDARRAKLREIPVFEDSREYSACMAALSVCRAAEASAGKDTSKAAEAIDSQLRGLEEEIQRLRQARAAWEQAETQRRRVRELEDRERQLAADFEKVAQGIYLCDAFTRVKVAMLTDRINGKFQSVRFRLFQEQLNGGLKEDCEVLVPNDGGTLVPYPFANNAARINAGLEIIEILSAFWGMEMPVFIDNAESVTHLAKTPNQTIRLVVSGEDKQLRMELA